jgi:hypothetical protein
VERAEGNKEMTTLNRGVGAIHCSE